MRKSTLLAVLVVGTLLVPVAVFASHSFNDVPDDHTFHDAIAWMKDNGVTVGCNPPSNTNYCPEDNVTRAQMAAFMRRLAENQVVDAKTSIVAGTAHEATRSELVTVAGTSSGTATSIATLTDLPAGAYVVTGTWVATAHGAAAGGRVVCNLTAGASTGRAIASIANPGAGPGEHGQRAHRHTRCRGSGEPQLLDRGPDRDRSASARPAWSPIR